jgi:hypothetical protein
MNESRAAARADLPVYKDYPEGYKWVELNKPGSFANESKAMGHSVRGYEPPKGHPDWVEGSGDSGSSSYGHGGWEAIKSGKAKVYSLVGPKGEPHTTIEVGPTHRDRGFFGDQRPTGDDYYSQQNKYIAGQNDGTVSPQLTFAEWWRSTQGIPEPEALPPRITQIKGKSNRAPNKEYLPYVQDFVRGGKWSDVGDFRNTGLTRKSDLIDKFSPDELDSIGVGEYLTKAEQEELLYRSLNKRSPRLTDELGLTAPPEGMANGGEVHMQVGGLSKLLKSALKKAPQEEALKLAQQRASLPKEMGGLGLPADNTAQQRAAAMRRNTDAYHGSKQDITGAFLPGYDDNLAFVTKASEFANKWIGKGKHTQRIGEQAKQEIKFADDMRRDIRSKNMNYDDALERLKGEEFNNEYDRRSALARAELDKEFPDGLPDKIHSTVYPLTVESNKIFNPETDMSVMAEFFKTNDIPQKVQDLYAGGNYMMYETKPVVEYLKSKGYDSMRLRESSGDDYPTIAVFNPESVRSRFAAHDPFRKTAATAAAMGVAAPDLLAEEKKKARGGLSSIK